MIEKVFMGLISLILNFIFLNYFDKLEKIKCGCSQDWRRDFIKVYSILVLSNLGVPSVFTCIVHT